MSVHKNFLLTEKNKKSVKYSEKSVLPESVLFKIVWKSQGSKTFESTNFLSHYSRDKLVGVTFILVDVVLFHSCRWFFLKCAA